MVIEISYAIELTKNLSDVHNNIFDISQNLIHYNVKKHHFNASLDLILSTKTQAWQLKLISQCRETLEDDDSLITRSKGND